MDKKMPHTDEQWKNQLDGMQYKVLRCSFTEAPFSGKFWEHHERGTYICAGCKQELFSSEAKFESGTGWPSFFKPVSINAIKQKDDYSHGMHRIEIICSNCGGHLGHVFPDGPKPTGLRYCLNSAALEFKKKK